jgi:hypothetical protein
MANDEVQFYGNAKDYVLVSRDDPETGARFMEEVSMREFETSEKYEGLTLDSPNVRLAHPPENQPAPGVTAESGQPDTTGRIKEESA